MLLRLEEYGVLMSQVSFNVLVQGRETPWGTAHYYSYSSFVKKYIGS